MLFAFLGGLILNMMPCVLPILAMKALSLATHGRHGRGESFAYAIGAVLSFAVLGLAIVLLRAGGQSVGWGFQLQSPMAVAGFALLVFAVALNLSGLFEVGSVTAGEGLTQKQRFTGAFFTGVLAVAVAAPCTAPFMAAALGFALTRARRCRAAVFVSLGLGFALPFLLSGVWPRALAFIPKPGPWMLTFKQFLAFPMYGAAAWLVWVLAQEAGPRSVAIMLAAFIALALAAWLWSVTRNAATRGRIIGTVAALLVLLVGLYGVGAVARRRRRAGGVDRQRRASPTRLPNSHPCARRGVRCLWMRPRPGASPAWSTKTRCCHSPCEERVRGARRSPIWWPTGPTKIPKSPSCSRTMAAPACRFIFIMRRMLPPPSILPQILTEAACWARSEVIEQDGRDVAGGWTRAAPRARRPRNAAPTPRIPPAKGYSGGRRRRWSNAAMHSGNHLRLAARDPSFCVAGGRVAD